MSEKILFTDLDGTLLTSDKKISPSMQLLREPSGAHLRQGASKHFKAC